MTEFGRRLKKIPEAYTLIRTEEVADIGSTGVLLRHRKTGARIALLMNDDNNKVFNIAFRTPPKDSTGVAHIIEHTVLCGSRKYPLKDPFVELAKGSLNTFLNAITFPDKTMYPVASCNEADFRNLMEVYLDAVFYPNIYNTEKIFRQEGWHYHLEEADAPLTLNGVVYNEMKGVFSSADSVLERMVYHALFPDTTYGVESGGDPDCIPDLTYEQFLDFHRSWYHPSNSFIYLYGDLDMEERLTWLDAEYLSRFEKKEIDSAISMQAPFAKRVELEAEYPVLDDEPLEDNTCLNLSVVTGDGLDILTSSAFNVLAYVLLQTPGAPLKQALLDAGIGKDVTGSYNDGIRQPFFSVDVKYANAADRDRFLQVITDTLERLAAEGLDEKALQAAIHFYEFRFREADFASYPKGLIYILNAYDGWLYDDDRPFDFLKQLDIFEELKAKIGTGYYENLIRERILANPHAVVLTLVPKRGLAAEKEAALAKKLAAYKASLSEEEIARIVSETAELAAYQEEEDPPEVKASLPMLAISDIDPKTPVRLCTQTDEAGGIPVLKHGYESRGISYLTLLFGVDDIENSQLPYLSLLKSVLGAVDTENYSYFDLSNEINARTGGIDCGLQVFPQKDGSVRRFFGIRSKYLDPECGFALSMMAEILFSSVLTDEKRLYEIVSSQKAQYQSYLPNAGHTSAVSRAAAGLTELDGWQEDISGLSYYRFLEGLFSDFENRKASLTENLKALARHIFRADNLTVSITASEAGCENLKAEIAAVAGRLYPAEAAKEGYVWAPRTVSEGIQTSGQVQYVAAAGNFRQKGYNYSGTLRILKTILSYDYLWMNLRVKGGAYGCMCAFKRTGDAYLVSYRDPHLENTLNVYRELPAYVEGFEADEATMTRFIIGTVSELDTPMNASALGSLALNAYFTGLTEETFQKERDEILGAGPAQIRSLAPLLSDTFDGKHKCVFGSETAISKHAELFDHIEPFVQG